MRIVVTGALGHIGSRLIRSIPVSFPGAELVLVDDLSTQRYCSLFDLPPTGRYRFIEADVASADLAPAFEGADVVVHLAAITDPVASLRIEGEVERVNVHGTEIVARTCIQTGALLVFPSTTSVYGAVSGIADEIIPAETLRPASPYARSKLRAEQLLAGLTRDGLRSVTLRLGTIAGPSIGMRFHTAVNRFCWQAVMGRPLTVWRTALDQRRPYLELGDAVRAIELVAGRSFGPGPYNVLTANATVAEIVAILRDTVPDLRIDEVEPPLGEEPDHEVDDGRFRALGFEPGGDLRSAIGETVGRLRGAGGDRSIHPRSDA